jgi:hypothetical protein
MIQETGGSERDAGRAALDTRLRRLRRAGVAGSLALLGVFAGFAATGDHGSASGSGGQATLVAPAAAPRGTGGATATPQADPSQADPSQGGYFTPYDQGGVGPGSGSGVPHASSGAS